MGSRLGTALVELEVIAVIAENPIRRWQGLAYCQVVFVLRARRRVASAQVCLWLRRSWPLASQSGHRGSKQERLAVRPTAYLLQSEARRASGEMLGLAQRKHTQNRAYMKQGLGIVACGLLLFIGPTHACPNTQPDLVGRRLTAPEIDALGSPVQSPCSNNQLPPSTKAETCTVRGPYQGIITGKQGTEGSLSDALTACRADPSCLGVSSVWYTQSPWFTVTKASSFAVDTASYGCTIVLDCRERE